jgi:hypothetical protein
MVEPTSHDAIVVLEASVTHDDPGEIVGSNVWFVNALFEEQLTVEEISADALRSYYVDYYLAQVNNGGFSQFVYNSRWSPLVVRLIREGMQAMAAQRHLEVFEGAAKLVEEFGRDRLDGYFTGEYFGENADRDMFNAPNDNFSAAEEAEDLLAKNADWLRGHPNLCPMPTEEDMAREARRRGETLPDRESRIAEARANEPRYMKLIRALCEQSGYELKRVTAGDPTRVHQGKHTLAWHFITDHGHHHMIDADGKAIMFEGHSTTNRVCEIEAPEDE